jgi:transposase
VVRDEFHLEEERERYRARLGSYARARRLPTDANSTALVDTWTENVAQALVLVRGIPATPEECRALGEEMALLFVAATEEDAADDARRQRNKRIQDDVCRRLTEGASKAAAAQGAGVSRETLHDWERKDPSLKRRVRLALSEGLDARKRAVAAPSKMVPTVLEGIVASLAGGLTRAQAIGRAGVSKQTFYTWLHRAPDFRADVLAAEDRVRSRRPHGKHPVAS